MKTLLTFLLLSMFLGCNGQDTVCFICYTQEQWDSAQSVSDSIIAARDQEILDIHEIYQNPELYGDSKITVYDSLSNKTTLQKTGEDLWLDIEKGIKRYKFMIVDNELEIWLGDSTKAELFLRYPLKE